MARDWGNQGRGGKLGCSYKRTTLIVCSINIVVALFVLRYLYASLYVYSSSGDSPNVTKYTPDQIEKMEESIRIRRAAKPLQLVKMVKRLEKRMSTGGAVQLPHPLKQKITDEILERLKGLNGNGTANEQKDAVESWRKEKLQEVKQVTLGNSVNSTLLAEEAGLLLKALDSNWDVLSEQIGLWIPTEVINKEHDDKPEGQDEIEEEVLPGRPVPPECNAELHTDYAGDAVRWGLTHHKESAAECCQACLDQAKYAKPGEKKCNIWVYCPSETGCFSPDIYEHKNQECWLKYAEQPKLNFKDKYSEAYRDAHPNAPLVVPWVSGVVIV
ncbi:uncharacterized protein LOC115675932 [Syzygium oleosum]|uniref:uncharacterized protein LOC115675932 n=1 Tax=Syzygium oleosum TaxID=219896 RepID=UPI0011D289E9|nr:uncharacterized protein LOC115675932 [Syzygium oleosum]